MKIVCIYIIKNIVNNKEYIGSTLDYNRRKKVLRSKEALEQKKTIVFYNEPGEDALVDFFDGSDIWDPFKEGYDDDFNTIKSRIFEQMDTMPLNLSTEDNHHYPASDKIKEVRIQLLKKYAPKKLAQNYS